MDESTPPTTKFPNPPGDAAYLDYLNPLAVNYLRQNLRSRKFIWGTAILLVMSCLGVAFATLMVYDRGSSPGKALFGGLYFLLNFSCLLLIPSFVSSTLTKESQLKLDEQYSISTLQPYQIVRGHLTGGLMIMVIIYSIFSPALVSAYVLQGPDFSLVLFALVGTALASIFLCQVVITTGSFISSYKFKVTGINKSAPSQYSPSRGRWLVIFLVVAFTILSSFEGGRRLSDNPLLAFNPFWGTHNLRRSANSAGPQGTNLNCWIALGGLWLTALLSYGTRVADVVQTAIGKAEGEIESSRPE